VTKRKAKHSLEARSQISRLKSQLDALYIRADPRSISDPEAAGDLACYLCVRVSGYLEQATAIIFRSYCGKNSYGEVQQFAMSWLDRTPNLSSDALLQLVKRFSNLAADELAEFLDAEERGSSINALIGIRNDIAHGRNQRLSRMQAWRYFEVVELVVEWLVDRFDPIPNKGMI
jgi:hypothetical protein